MIPININRQNYRENYPIIIDVESYFHQSIYVPYTEHLLVQVSERLKDQMMKCQNLWNLISKYTATLTSPSEKKSCWSYTNMMLITKLSLFQKFCAGKKVEETGYLQCSNKRN